MAWTIEHLAVPYSETDIADWAVELRLVLSPGEWRVVEALFDIAAAFTVSPRLAGRIAGILADAAHSSRMHPSMVRMTEDMAAAARTAADQRQSWHWA
jgi:hypothetical protein